MTETATMRLLVSSHAFAPSRGGLETATRLLAEEFTRRGHAVTVLTQTGAEAGGEAFPYEVIRRPSASTLFREIGRADLVWHNHLSLRTGWPQLLPFASPKPWVITHQTWLSQGGLSLSSRLKRIALGKAFSIAISEPIAAALPVPSERIPNPYDDRIFHSVPGTTRDGEVIAVGRLVSDKGFDLLFRALGKLRREGRAIGLTVVGSGPEEGALRDLAAAEGIAGQVAFAGSQPPEAVAALLRRHRVLAVPSRWAEPFGIVALEGIACGCVAVASRGGGLPEAVGPCGFLFENGDVDGLAAALVRGLDAATAPDPQRWRDHAARFTRERIGDAYLACFRQRLEERR
ncbi:Glycosyltransferase involved in cell wall bisynthesis [Verrucomicrobium sp. GAS474]|uniref:glycosyltransferase family 4 protein n=1 Tax=Verrucomicrobium sp. GAS474 TaxID=1882831 RepID=UPI00087AB5CC|nr:glycosyltransferase family 4 protein [Verrucomicrobium sp. GAS474]SDT86130.1 Glycosyltransferase involved in cell wall bisynthesis [Verrucomicrobium sp. GAS474]